MPKPCNVHTTICRQGMTLVDTLVTVLIVAILAAVSVPRFGATIDRYRSEAAAFRIQADLRWVRQQAVSRSASHTVEFVPATNSYRVAGLEDLNRSGQPYIVNLSEPPYRVELVSSVSGADGHIQFDRFGQPDDAATITVAAGGIRRTVIVDPDTGLASVP